MHAAQYKIETVLDETSSFVLYRAYDRNGRAVLLKALKTDRPSPVDTEDVLLRHECEASRLLGGDVTLHVEELASLDGRPMLVLRDEGGVPLARLTGAPWELDRFLPLAITLADVLGTVHGRQIVHLGLNPHDIFMMPDGTVRLTGFGYGAALARSASTMWPYLSPEQTGRLDLPVDHRSDLYSLGVIYFQLLTGELPFKADDLLGWIHSHCAVAPPSPIKHAPALPVPIAEIVLKLLTKLADDSYQSAAGVRHDLARCRDAWMAERRIEPFALAQADVPPPLRLASKLYGRDDELARLLDALVRAGAGARARVVFLSGPAGIGKTELVRHLRRAVAEQSALFASGKCGAVEHDTPCEAVLSVLQELISEAIEESRDSPELLDQLRDRLVSALRLHASLLAGVLPALARIVEVKAPPPEVALQEGERRFLLALSELTGAFAQPGKPVAVFFDDLQWADAGTLKVMESWADPGIAHLLLIGAFRSTEVSPSHPVRQMIERMADKGVDMHEVVLGPLSAHTVTRWVADSLRCPPEEAAPLAELIHEKTGGNPLFIEQFARCLDQEGLVYFSADSRAWRWDLPRIQAKRYSDCVAGLIAARIQDLSPATQQALQVFASHGAAVDLSTLAILFDATERAVLERLESAFSARLIVRVDNEIRFLHDRIQQVAYDLVPPRARPEIHIAIGRALISRMAPEQIAARVFEVVHHINAGASKITSREERVQAAEMNLMAAEKAQALADYASAVGFSTTGIASLKDAGSEHHQSLAFGLQLTLARCHFALGHIVVAQDLCLSLLARAREKVDAAKVHCLLADIRMLGGAREAAMAMESCLEGLRLFGVSFPSQPTEAEVDAAYHRTSARLAERPIATLADLPVMIDASARATCDLVAALYAPAALINWNIYHLATTVAVGLSLTYGNTASSAPAYGAFGLGLAQRYRRYREAFALGEVAYRLVTEHEEYVAYRTRASFLYTAMLSFLGQPIGRAMETLRHEFDLALSTADSLFCSLFCDEVILFRIFAGDPLDEVDDDAARIRAAASRAGPSLWQNILPAEQKLIERLRDSHEVDGFADTAFEDELEQIPTRTMRFHYYLNKLRTRFILGDHKGALEAAARAWSSHWIPASHLVVAEHHFYEGLALAATEPLAPPDRLEMLNAHRDYLQGLAESCPANFAVRATLMSAELARLSGDELAAERMYEQAILAARADGFVHIEGIAGERAAQFHMQRGFETIANAYLSRALDCYEAWGARSKVELLIREHPELERRPAPAARGAEGLDVLGIVKASQLISSSLVVSDLYARLLAVALEHAGAERGCLLLMSPRGLILSATSGAGATGFGAVEQPADPSRLPLSICKRVRRTHNPVLVADAQKSHRFTKDPYFSASKAIPRSILCVPIVRQHEVTSLLYLENNLVPGAFAGARLDVLDILASQAAISLENARFCTELREENAERRRAETSLRESRMLLQSIIDNTTAVIYVKDAEGRYLLVNRRFEEIWYTRRDVLGKTDRELFAREEAAMFRTNDETVLRENRAMEFDESVSQNDGMHEYISLKFPLRDSQGKPYAMCGISTDVTIRKQAEGALRQSLSLLEATLESTADGILVVDKAGRMTQFNQRFIEMWHIPESILAQRDDDKALAFVRDQLQDPDRFMSKIVDLYLQSEACSFDVLRFKDGRVFERYSQPQYISGRVVGRVWSFRDVTQRVQAEAQRDRLLAAEQHARLQAEEAVRLRDEFLSVASHELRTPLTSLQLAIQGLEARLFQGIDTERTRRALGLAARQVRRLSTFVDLLLDVSRIAADTLHLVRTQVDLRSVVVDVSDKLAGELARSGSVLHVQAGESVVGDWDRHRLEQVVTHLLTNAIKFGRAKPIEIAVTKDTRSARLAVTDSGIGIAPDKQAHIFERFGRGVSTRHYGGLGLGLYVIHAIVEAHGGRVSVKSEVGRGSTFTVELPLSLQAEAPRSK